MDTNKDSNLFSTTLLVLRVTVLSGAPCISLQGSWMFTLCILHHMQFTHTGDKMTGVIYSCQCGEIACVEEYIGETSRTLGEKCREHLKEPSPICVHSLQTGHNSTPDNFTFIGREDQGLARTIIEYIYIRVNNPTLNRNIGRFNLNHTRDSLF